MIVPTKIPETFHWLQLVGFILLIIGTLIYNEILVFPCGGFDTNTKAAKEARNEKAGRISNVSQGTKNSFVHK